MTMIDPLAAHIFDLVGNRFGFFDTPCPACSPHRKPQNRKLNVLRIWRNEDDFLTFNCAHCYWHGHAHRGASNRSNVPPPGHSPAAIKVSERTDAERTAAAMQLWRAAVSTSGTLVDAYLAGRGLHLPDDVLAGDAIRFHPRCPYERDRLPCMLALFTDAIGEPRGVHRTALRPDGAKIGRMALGPIGGCVIRLWPDEAVEQGLVVGEGIETCLAAATRVEHNGTLLRPAWAAGFAENMKSFPPLPGIEALTLLVDNDASGIGQDAAEQCARRWQRAGRQVIRLVPFRHGSDFADLALEMAS